ncbi:MAG: hypothetical protein CL944_00020 [Candidatus Diapherotrites archaeon]|uniref:Uncharacterized protein n=1 Tax=Candidatus Iainarchaeum sp. TaxID=3101447 RepID=A0A2D6LNT5_9ARCH|nr:hypothetical protein [Candidatus Diapherotrites archaeon]|tara:strand:- start:1643 stop:1906 length:264 start_codon:yes stop_codon:yes gene_type:complete
MGHKKHKRGFGEKALNKFLGVVSLGRIDYRPTRGSSDPYFSKVKNPNERIRLLRMRLKSHVNTMSHRETEQIIGMINDIKKKQGIKD